MTDTVPTGGSTEPVIGAAAISAGVTAVVTLFTVFGAHITADQAVAIVGAVGAVVPVVLAFFARSKVTPLAAPKTSLGVPLVPADTTTPPTEGDGGI